MTKKRTRAKCLGQWVDIQHCDLTEEGLLGDCDPSKRIIRIEVTLEGAEYKRIEAHEFAHMKMALSGLVEMMSPELEEALAVLAESK